MVYLTPQNIKVWLIYFGKFKQTTRYPFTSPTVCFICCAIGITSENVLVDLKSSRAFPLAISRTCFVSSTFSNLFKNFIFFFSDSVQSRKCSTRFGNEWLCLWWIPSLLTGLASYTPLFFNLCFNRSLKSIQGQGHQQSMQSNICLHWSVACGLQVAHFSARRKADRAFQSHFEPLSEKKKNLICGIHNHLLAGEKIACW